MVFIARVSNQKLEAANTKNSIVGQVPSSFMQVVKPISNTPAASKYIQASCHPSLVDGHELEANHGCHQRENEDDPRPGHGFLERHHADDGGAGGADAGPDGVGRA